MKIRYRYHNELFDDMRDIVENNSMTPDYQYIMEEYLPFQSFISKRTCLNGVTIEPSERYVPSTQMIPPKIHGRPFNEHHFSEAMGRYCLDHDIPGPDQVVAAVSGGVDSSAVALELGPCNIYSGYYNSVEHDEREFSELVASQIKANHCTFELGESHFIDNIDNYMSAICSPIAGMGGIMEYALLGLVTKEYPDVKHFLFGNGGDEVFMGYYYNHYIKKFVSESSKPDEFMPNFVPTKKRVGRDVVDSLIIALLNKGSLNIACSEFVVGTVLPMLGWMSNYIDKLLYCNINVILPSLLHVNNQICRAHDIHGHNPLANKTLIKYARHLNTPPSEIPKELLRSIHSNMPKAISGNTIKRGFPLPFGKWKEVRKIIRKAYDRFFKRPQVTMDRPRFDGSNRRTWGIFQAELFLRKYE
jgi:hypothetical protein